MRKTTPTAWSPGPLYRSRIVSATRVSRFGAHAVTCPLCQLLQPKGALCLKWLKPQGRCVPQKTYPPLVEQQMPDSAKQQCTTAPVGSTHQMVVVHNIDGRCSVTRGALTSLWQQSTHQSIGCSTDQAPILPSTHPVSIRKRKLTSILSKSDSQRALSPTWASLVMLKR
jgi:hypothetical protein